MTKSKTMGRWPTLGELIEYYLRDDICAVIYYQTKRWNVITGFPPGNDLPLTPKSEKETGEEIVRRLRELARGVRETERLAVYPTMHMLKNRGDGYDFMIENDSPSWRQAFDSLTNVLDVLDAHNVFYQLKFSGHRSLHLLIVAESLPPKFRGMSVYQQFDMIQRRILSYLPKIRPYVDKPIGLRLVISTHPKSGMVSLPLRRIEVSNFRPWMANIHTVAVDFDWFSVPEDALERNTQFLNTVFDHDENKPVSVSLPHLSPLPVRNYTNEPVMLPHDVINGLDAASSQMRVAATRAALVEGIQLSSARLGKLLRDPEADVVWFATEISRKAGLTFTIDDVSHFLGKHDQYLIALAYELMAEEIPVEAWFDYLTVSGEISGATVAILRMFSALELCPTREDELRAVAESRSSDIEAILKNAIDNRNPFVQVREYIRELRNFCEDHKLDDRRFLCGVTRSLVRELVQSLKGAAADGEDFSVLLEILQTWSYHPMPPWILHDLAGEVDALCDVLISQRNVTPNTTAAMHLLAGLSLDAFVLLPRRIHHPSLQTWFENAWVVCASGLCLGTASLFRTAIDEVGTFDAEDAKKREVIRQLDWLWELQSTEGYKIKNDEPIIEAANALIQRGYDIRAIAASMLTSPNSGVCTGGIRLIAHFEWEGSIEWLIGQFLFGSARRKAAHNAIIDIGEPAVDVLIKRVESVGQIPSAREQRIFGMCVEALGQIGAQRAIDAIAFHVNHPVERIRANARRVLVKYFDVTR